MHVESTSKQKGIYKSKMELRGPSELVNIVTYGVPVSDASKLSKHFNLAVEEVAFHVSGSKAKFKKRVADGQFSPVESDRLVRLARLMAAAEALHDGDADAAREWMESPKQALGGVSPMSYARTEVGAREVEHLIGRLEHGVFS